MHVMQPAGVIGRTKRGGTGGIVAVGDGEE